MNAYYSENDPKAAAWLRELIRRGLIANGDVDERSIEDVRPDDLRGYTQCHFFAGIGGWSLALRLAGWPDDRRVWTGSCPCQPFSTAGKGAGFADQRHLWPAWFHLIRECAPAAVFGEQVASASDWIALVLGDLEGLDYAVGAVPIEAASAGAFHRRDRFWFVADARGERLAKRERNRGVLREVGSDSEGKDAADDACAVGNTDGSGSRTGPYNPATGHGQAASSAARRSARDSIGWIVGHDGKARPVEPSIPPLVNGVPALVVRIRGYGNAIDIRPATAFIDAYLEARAAA